MSRLYKDPPPVPTTEEELKSIEWQTFLKRSFFDFRYFCEAVLGYHDLNEIHGELCEFISSTHKRKLVLLPRLTFKSSIITIGYTLWRLLKDQNLRVLVYSDSTPKAQSFLRGIKNYLEGRSGLWASHIGNWRGEITWNENQITISNRKRGAVEPTVDTSGIESSKVGMHYNLIIFDDIVSDVNVTNKQQMDKVYDCYKRSHSLLMRTGEIIMVGTRWHFGDAYGRIMSENEDTKEYRVMVRSAEEKRGDGLIFDDIGEESLTETKLAELKRVHGSYLYSCLFLNSPVDDEEALFKHNKFQFYGRLDKSEHPFETGLYEYLYITCTIDPAGMGGDRTGGVVVGTDQLMRMFILEILNKHLQPHQIIDWVVEMNLRYKLRKLGIETKFFRGMLKRELEVRIKDEQVKSPLFNNFGITEFSPSRGDTKFIRIQALQPYFERQAILFPGKNTYTLSAGFSDLAEQMMQVTPTHMPEPNDLIDALAYQVPLLQAGGVAKVDMVPENSPADLERQWVKQWNRMQKGVPRHKRVRYKTWLS